MLKFSELGQGELLAPGRRASDLCAWQFEEIIRASDPVDLPLQEVLRETAFDALAQADVVDQCEYERTEDLRLASHPNEGLNLIRSALPSLTRSGESPLHRDEALFYAEVLEGLYRVLAAQSRESRSCNVFTDTAEDERDRLQDPREVVLRG